jgi:hypothetical protein
MKKDSVQYKGKWHTSVDNEMIRNVELSFPARFLWILLKSYASPSSPVPYPGFETLAHFMSSFRKDRHTKATERKPMDEDTLRKYRQELVDKGFLIVERIRNGFAEWENNRYILMDGDPHPDFSGLEKSGAGGHPGRCGTGAKEVPLQEEVPAKRRGTSSSSSTLPSARATAATKSTPSAAQSGDTPEPPTPDPGPRRKTDSFIKLFKYWARQAGIINTVVPQERDDLQAFFTDNEDTTPEQLFAIQVTAWMMKEGEITPGTEDHEAFWFCRLKSKRIATFIQHLPQIMDELEWAGGKAQVDAAMAAAHRKYVHKKAA